MEGQGVINYGLNKPTYGFSAETTEFDDELIRRGIVSFEETMMRKGASVGEATRLKEVKERGGRSHQDGSSYINNPKESDDGGDENEFLEQHRRKRLQELKSEQSRQRYGEVYLISRPEWARHVNQDSEQSWVVVNLTSNDMERTGCVESAVTALALRHVSIKFVHIPSKSAIANWPDDHLPTLFLYRHGKMQHQLLELPRDISTDQLEWRLHKLGLLTVEEVVEQQALSSNTSEQTGYGAASGARSSTLASLEDYDEVD